MSSQGLKTNFLPKTNSNEIETDIAVKVVVLQTLQAINEQIGGLIL
jgi:hypothetical protein